MTNKQKQITFGIIAGILFIGILGGGMWWLIGSSTQETPASQQNEQSSSQDSSSDQNNEGWKTYEADQLGFHIKHPPEASVKTPKADTRVFRITDSDQSSGKKSPSMQITISTDKAAKQYDSLEVYGGAKRRNTEQEAETSIGIESFENARGYAYADRSTDTQIQVDYVFMNTETSNGYEVSVNIKSPSSSVSSPTKQRYKDITQRMLNSLSFQ